VNVSFHRTYAVGVISLPFVRLRAGGRAVLYYPKCLGFCARRAQNPKQKIDKYHAAAGQIQL
jgi:hypothetical protein